MNMYAHVIPEVQESAMQLLSQALAPLEREGDLALMARLSPKGWTLNARLIAQDGQVEERVYLCGKVDATQLKPRLVMPEQAIAG
jgi:hypothetical protein